MKRKVFPQNIKVRYSSTFYIAAEKELLPKEHTKQGDPLAVAMYSTSTQPLLNLLMSLSQ